MQIDLKQKTTSIILTFALVSGLLMIWYSFFILHANDHYVALWGDGYKNYYTFAYYVAYGRDWHFAGMNYPFGEHIVFSDSQPALAFVVRHLASFVHTGGHLHGLFVLWMYLSIPLCAVAILIIFAEFNIVGLYAIISASFIALLSPQIGRMGGHFGMSFCFLIPSCILLLIRYSKTGRSIFLFLIITLVTFFGLVHIYNLAILSAFVMAYAMLYFLIAHKTLGDIIAVLKLFITALIPFVIVKIFLLLTDPTTDRPDNPWGFFDNCSTYDTIFLHPGSMINSLITKFVFLPDSSGERWAYIGIAADLLLLVFLVSSILRFTHSRRILREIHPSLIVAFGASIIVLLFSSGLPFTISGCKHWFDYAGPLKQFRAPCRFAWVFYYMANIFAAIYFVQLLSVLNIRKVFKGIILTILFIVWFFDINKMSLDAAVEFHRYGRIFDAQKERSDLAHLLASQGLSAKDFQAIFGLPFFSIGSEKTAITSASDMSSMKVSLYTGLGSTEAELSRTSLTQADMNLQLISNDLIEKQVIKLYHSVKPLLLVVSDGYALTERETQLVSRAKFIGKTFVFSDTVSLYTLPLSAFDGQALYVRTHIDSIAGLMIDHHTYQSSSKGEDVICSSYEDNKRVPFVRFGKGALFVKDVDTVLFEGSIISPADSTMYEFSIWNYGDLRVCSYPIYKIIVCDHDHQQIGSYERLGSTATDVFDKWIRVNIRFMIPSRDCIIKVIASGKFASYDELMIRPVNVNVLTHTSDSGIFMYNNYPIERK